MDPEEHFFDCPYCAEHISIVLDVSAGAQTYIEDCEVCCRPIEIGYDVADEKVVDFSAKTTT